MQIWRKTLDFSAGRWARGNASKWQKKNPQYTHRYNNNYTVNLSITYRVCVGIGYCRARRLWNLNVHQGHRVMRLLTTRARSRCAHTKSGSIAINDIIHNNVMVRGINRKYITTQCEYNINILLFYRITIKHKNMIFGIKRQNTEIYNKLSIRDEII